MSWAGSERCLSLILELFPDADLIVGLLAPELRDLNVVTQRAAESWLARIPTARTNYQWLLPLEAIAFRSIDTRPYDLVISSSHALAKAVRPGARGVHLSYCYSPPRYIWDQHDVYMARTNWKRRAAMAMGRRFLQVLDRSCARGVTHFSGISQYVAQRIHRVYGRGARVIYPPVERKGTDTAPRKPAREDFLLSLGRLVPYKRIDVIVRAAERHGVRTLIAGEGRDSSRLEKIAGKNVEFLGSVSESEAGHLLDRCRAFVFCAEDDFGIAPLEANAHGAPVVALAAGATLETMREGETAMLFPEASEEALSTAVGRALTREWDDALLRANAARFSPARFRAEFAAATIDALSGKQW